MTCFITTVQLRPLDQHSEDHRGCSLCPQAGADSEDGKGEEEFSILRLGFDWAKLWLMGLRHMSGNGYLFVNKQSFLIFQVVPIFSHYKNLSCKFTFHKMHAQKVPKGMQQINNYIL
ncbi:hypothetical protein KSP39_PZI000114 [Platanthera zijinensis]|uniref:Uncharacterized protein n=1 Tax=Platanthera zijinensis TaxID=2320716 RepID=A0AAP0C313_9ASPA